MGVNNKGLGMIGSFLRGLETDNPSYAIFDIGSLIFQPNIYNAEDEKYRGEVSWAGLDNVDSRATIIIPTNTLVGSNIQAVGLATGSTDLGSDMVARELTAFGEKTQYQNWVLEFDWRNRSF